MLLGCYVAIGIIARAIVETEVRLTGPEIRFLRKRLGKKAVEFAQIVGVTPEQVSRWENNANLPDASTDKLIRAYELTMLANQAIRCCATRV